MSTYSEKECLFSTLIFKKFYLLNSENKRNQKPSLKSLCFQDLWKIKHWRDLSPEEALDALRFGVSSSPNTTTASWASKNAEQQNPLES